MTKEKLQIDEPCDLIMHCRSTKLPESTSETVSSAGEDSDSLSAVSFSMYTFGVVTYPKIPGFFSSIQVHLDSL